MMKNLGFLVSCAINLLTMFLQDGDANLPWMDHMVKYIENNLKISNILFIIENDTNMTDNIIQKVQFALPHKIIGLTNATEECARQMSKNPLFQDLRTTTLILTIISIQQKNDYHKLFNLTKFLIPLHGFEPRSRCIMLISSGVNELRYRRFLHQMWLNNFLDFIVVESMQIGQNRLDANKMNFVRIHQYDPFKNSYKIRNYTKGYRIFRDKLRNMNFKLKVGTFDQPPFVYVKRNLTNHPIEISGLEANIAQEIATRMQFTKVEVPSEEEWFGDLNFIDPSKYTGFFKQLFHKEIDFLTNWALYSAKLTWSRGKVINFDRLCALIPSSEIKHWNVQYQWTWCYFILIILIISCIKFLMEFKSQVWSPLYILLAMLVFPVPKMPGNTIEKIVFISMLVSFTIFSSSFFAVLTDVKMIAGSKTTIDTLEQLNRSNFTPMMRVVYVQALVRNNDSLIQDLLKKTLTVKNEEECIDILKKHRNVTCFLREITGIMAIRNSTDLNGKATMEMVDETVYFYLRGMFLQPASPFVANFNKVLTELVESGLIYHWEKPLMSLMKGASSLELNKEESSNILSLQICILIVGCLTSILTFIGELLMHCFGKNH